MHGAGADGSAQTSQAMLHTSVTDPETAHNPCASFLINFDSGKMEQWVMLEEGQKSKRSNFKKMKACARAHTHTEDRCPQPARGPFRLIKGPFQLLNPQAP